MKFQKFCLQEKIQQNHGLVNGFNINYAKRFSQQYGVQERPCQTGVFEKSTDNIDRTNSSSTIMGHIGSPGSAFFATERYMGLPYYDSQDNNPSLCSEISKNFDVQIPCFQQSVADNSYVDQSSLEQANTSFPPLQPAAESSSCIDNLYNSTVSEKSYPERDLIMQLKRKLLEDNYDTPDKRRSIVACDGDSCLNQAQNLYGYQVANVAQSAGTSGNDVVSSDSAITSCKTRIRWSQELHDRFVECVNRLGGSEKATPKAILRLMESDVLTIYHVKSHLQKYRITKYMPDSAEGKSEKKTSTNDVEQTGTKTGMQLKEALKLQIAVQKRLYEQLEIQKHLQLRIEEQAKQLKQMFDLQQQKTNSFNETQQSSSEPPPDESLIAESNGTPQRPLEID